MSSYEQLRSRGPAAFAEETGRTRYWDLLAAERASMRDGTTGLVRDELVEHAACAACGHDSPYGGFIKEGFRYVRCGECGTVYVNPQLTEEAMMRFWTSSPVAEAWTEVLRHPAQREFDETKFGRLLDDLGASGVSGGNLLDFGCSVGGFLALARARGYGIAGIEPGEGARRIAKEMYGLEISPSLELIDPGVLFKVITSWEVLEHTKHPAEHLRALGRFVEPDGRLIVLVGGNAASFATRVMRASSAAFEFARYWYFTPASFARLLGRSGWEVVKMEQMLDELDVVLAYLGYGDAYQPPGFEEEVLPLDLVAELRKYVMAHGMGYKFLVTARPS